MHACVWAHSQTRSNKFIRTIFTHRISHVDFVISRQAQYKGQTAHTFIVTYYHFKRACLIMDIAENLGDFEMGR